ncbi:Neuropeptide receptor A20, partial [Operophtera brumata]
MSMTHEAYLHSDETPHALSDEQRDDSIMLADNDTHASANGTYDFFEEPSFISVLKHRGSNNSANIGEVLRVLEDWRNRYNISVVKECERSEYCSGEFRDLILAYNSIHGYVIYFVDSDYDGTLYQVNFWVHAVLIKLLPCLILTVISAWLIRALYRVNTKKKALKGYSACAVETVKNGNGNVFTRKSTKRSKAERRTDRTTKMLGLLGRCFFKRCYDLFGEMMDALALLNGAINFVLYCSMSRQFRTTFGLMMRSQCQQAPRAGSHTELHTTY